ncbi:MAG: signal peptidase I [Saprospiraceae bacterium]
MSILIFLVVSYILLSYSLSLLFPKAGVDAIKGWIPGVNFMEWAKLIGKKPVYALWLLFPIVNLFIFCGMAVDLARSFGRHAFGDAALSVIYAPAIFFRIAKNEKDKYTGPVLIQERDYYQKMEEAKAGKDSYQLKKLNENNPYQKSALREWVESIVFAVFAAAFIRMFLIEAYVIPTPSMEGSLNVGDFLFVSKAHYGIRTPMTVAMIPLLHNTVPVVGGESYLHKPSLPYYRLPAIEKVESGKPFVFNWPVGDSVYVTSQRSYTVSQVANEPYFLVGDRELAQKVKKKEFVVRPVDKKDHYIKRCVAGPGDSLQIINKQIYINGKPQKNPEHLQYFYIVQLPPNVSISTQKMDSWGVDFGDTPDRGTFFKNGQARLFLDNAQVEKFKALSPDVIVQQHNPEPNPLGIFPFDPAINNTWTVDNYGPIWIPKKGSKTTLDMSNIAFYKRAISVYEKNTLDIKGEDIYINGVKSTEYTFTQDYYWAMGDNRHNSEDSRMWGYVPFDHVVGKPLFIFFSTKEGSMKNGINWDRIFKSASK